MNDLTRPKWLAAVCVLAAALSASRVGAQSTATAGGQNSSSNPTPGPAALTPATGCSTIPSPASAGGASIEPDAGESLQHKSWQPIGGEVQFTVKSFVAIPANASVFTCFRWKSGRKAGAFIESPSRLDLSGDGKLLKVTTTVPHGLGPKPDDVAKALPLVPLTEVRILAIDGQNNVKADATSEIGITSPVAAFVFAIAVMILGFAILYAATSFRLTHTGILKANWLLRIISTPSGFASLSQLQIVLWTFVVAISAVYVMSLSGELIQITNGTLVLLGIAGAAGIGAKVHTEAQGATAEASATTAAADKAAADVIAAQKAAAAANPPADPVAAARIAEENRLATMAAADKAVIATATRARADAMKNPPAAQTPRWSDLIVNESVKDDGTVMREIDVARFQMLLFTLITATFVLMNVVTTYVIPEISTGFQTLMGISNGVYLGSKVAQRS